jgi:hypothetical protein
MRSATVSRRTVTRSLIGSALVAAAPFPLLRGYGTMPSSIPASFNEVLAQFERSAVAPFASDELVEVVAAGRQVASAAGIDDTASIVAHIIGGDLEALPPLSASEVRARLEQNIRADFAAGRVATAGGWILSRTELLILSLAAWRT